MGMREIYREILNQLEKEHNLRQLPGNIPEGYINLSSNDYLGLNQDTALRNEFYNLSGTSQFHLSASSSRLLTGNSNAYNVLETTIKNSHRREACLVYNSGYHANIGILSALAGKNDLIVADKQVHASIIDGMQLSKATVQRYKHLDYHHLEKILQKSRHSFQHIFIVSESIFSMDGDVADLPLLVELKKKYGACLYLDEAHAVGVRGRNGLGCAEEAGCMDACDFIVGTFGKAMASVGAYLVCDEVYKHFLVNHSRSLIFTTALPPVNLAWTNFLFERLPDFEDKRNHLKELSVQFAKMMNVNAETHIVPFLTGSNESAIQASMKLRDHNYYVLPVRYPTVPKGKARLRFSLGADMNITELQKIPQIILCDEKDLGQ